MICGSIVKYSSPSGDRYDIKKIDKIRAKECWEFDNNLSDLPATNNIKENCDYHQNRSTFLRCLHHYPRCFRPGSEVILSSDEIM